MRHQTGLRNRFRSGRSSYSIRGKSSGSDSYGQWSSGTQVRAERIAGHTLTRTKEGEWTSSESVRTAASSRREHNLTAAIVRILH